MVLEHGLAACGLTLHQKTPILLLRARLKIFARVYAQGGKIMLALGWPNTQYWWKKKKVVGTFTFRSEMSCARSLVCSLNAANYRV
jgi:hypothetical protein